MMSKICKIYDVLIIGAGGGGAIFGGEFTR